MHLRSCLDINDPTLTSEEEEEQQQHPWKGNKSDAENIFHSLLHAKGWAMADFLGFVLC